MLNIALFGKTLSETNRIYLQEMIQLLENDNIQIFIYKPFIDIIQHQISFKHTPVVFNHHRDLMQHQIDYLFSIGGDGTLLDTITLIRDSHIPVLGINLGRLGFLSSVSKQDMAKAIQEIKQKKYKIDKRSLIRLNTETPLFGEDNFAINEFTVSNSGDIFMLNVAVHINGLYFNNYWGNGVIISTPTGSTAYSMSCGGPIIMPGSQNFVITPIASHNLTVRPFVIPDESTINLKVSGRINNYKVSLDARSVSLNEPIDLLITKEKFNIHLIQLEEENFFNTIRKKLNWGLDNRN